MMKNKILIRKLSITFIIFVFLGFALLFIVKPPFCKQSGIEQYEVSLLKGYFHLIQFPVSEKPMSISLPESILDKYQVYARNSADDSYFHVNDNGVIISDGNELGRMEKELEFLFNKVCVGLYIDGKRAKIDLEGFTFYYLTQYLLTPPLCERNYPEINMADSFMRSNLFADSNWSAISGNWELNQYGAGLDDDRDKLLEKALPRTVNPFSVRGALDGLLSYGNADYLNYQVEANFFFGVPQTSQVQDINSLPGSFALIQGKNNGNQIRFGWDLPEKRFILSEKLKDGTWKHVHRWRNLRPPISSWIKLGLSIEDGFKVKAYIDEIPVIEYDSDLFISGTFHIASGTGLIEVDDVKAFQLNYDSGKDTHGTPLFIESTTFSSKNLTDHDELQYQKWARAESVFKDSQIDSYCYITSTDAIPGDLYYESIPFSSSAGILKDGSYIYKFLEGSSLNSDSPELHRELFSLKMRRESNNWFIDDEKYPGINGKCVGGSLRIARLKENGNKPAVLIDKKWVHIADPAAGFVHVSVGFNLSPPNPGHHNFTSTESVNELFEEAPVGWIWTEGKFRMASRWACADLWNFMAGGATGTPWMASKKCFMGNQSHEYYMSLRPMQPPEGGDDNFSYDPRNDTNWKIFIEHFGWYNKHDLNFAFCSDGVNPLSGYAVIYAAGENTKNFLLRNGEVVAENSLYLMPDTSQNHAPIHWKWWNFRCSINGQDILVKLNDKVLFEYKDTEPLDGGHVGFFSVRNGFAVAKINSFAERIEWNPFFMFVEELQDDTQWYPLVRDNVKIEKTTGQFEIKVSQQIGGGNLAVRHDFDNADLEKSDVLSFPLALSTETSVNLFLFISGRSYVVQLNDNPLSRTKALLTPEFERGEMFQLPFKDIGILKSPYFLGKTSVADGLNVNLLKLLNEKGVKPPYLLESITIGNTSEENFLLFGAEKNRKGANYRVGKIKLTESVPKTNNLFLK